MNPYRDGCPVRIVEKKRRCIACLMAVSILVVSMAGCDMSSATGSGGSSAVGTFLQNVTGFLFDFARQLLAAFIF